ncbi:Nitrogen fixation regulation protein FixK [Methyloligella halotolerans]|uniref:Nitrogen fixation regulation protein FixK n=1 Tax=Methyloligella halotolerans TaxID=1177755 RepID=A0A1E2RYK5_9HYPH|nr:Crp/Fnr family transcriptional regulator [Methyloligella halotolerans]ODA67195.1 Nitrogen fixation regulation protein FixK [Methyloligella halotolerans]
MGLVAQFAVDYKVPCDRCPLRDCAVFQPLSDGEVDLLSEFKIGEFSVEGGATLFSEGVQSDQLFTVLSGWSFRYKTLSDGRRQIINFILPGDFIGLQSTLDDEMDHSVESLTAASFCTFPRKKLTEFFARSPRLAFDVTWLAAREERVLDEHLLSLGRRTARERAAYYLTHLYIRASEVGLSVEGRVRFPFTQQHLADALGLSLVHTNKILRRLTADGLIEWEHGLFRSPNLGALAELGGFDLEDRRERPLL